MRIYYPRKTGKGMCCGMYGKGRSVHTLKRGGYAPLLLSPGLGTSTGSGLPSLQKIEETKPQMNRVIERLGKLQMEQPVIKKRKNISFKL